MAQKAIIWDWGRTLFSSEDKVEFPESEDLLKYCQSKGYRMVVVSKSGTTPYDLRVRQIEGSPLLGYFEKTWVTKKDKDLILDQAVKFLNLSRRDIWIIGDRIFRDILYAIKYGHPSIWIRKGIWAHQLPTEETGQPDYIVEELKELYEIL